ncbi:MULTISPECIES: hypothetical protein [unclassified Curtobacterium]|uniref:hypothetical protein n=1 Tax=unclassified Curtobacterium TaxID=257496 RepID=UPI003A8058A2
MPGDLTSSRDTTSDEDATSSEDVATRRTLLSVLPLTTAWAGAIAVVAVPVLWTLVGMIVEQSLTGAPFLVMMIPVLAFAVLGAFVFGLVAGALAGLPDWCLRRRPPSALGAVAAVVVLTAIVTGTFAAAPVLGPVFSALLPLPGWVGLATVAAATATGTIIVVSRARRQEQRITAPGVTGAGRASRPSPRDDRPTG